MRNTDPRKLQRRQAVEVSECNTVCPDYDQRHRQWRHVDTGMYRTLVVADLPRVECPEYGVRTVSVPWAEPRARSTVEFEALVIDWL